MILAVIPARKGSRRLPGKNTRLLGGKPLVAWTFEVALKVKCLDRIMVSTDDPEVKRIAEEYGVEVPFFPRPPEISEDVDTVLVLKHAVGWMQKYESLTLKPFDGVVTLQPTSPFRLAEDIDGAVRMYKSKNNFSSVMSVSEIVQHPYWAFSLRENGSLYPFASVPLRGNMLVSQNLPKFYYPNGIVYVTAKDLVDGEVMFSSTRNYGYLMPPERSVDVETELDLIFAQALLDKGVVKP